MCGICGIYDCRRERRIDPKILAAMNDALIHRGPDDCGYFFKRNAGLGFRRLSIIDLDTGNQPLFNENRSLALVCNGEIFNYKELRKQLISKGHSFFTKTDVEVIVHLYEEYGDALCERLNGQFAFAIYDIHRDRIFIARDHTGVAPLFYAVVDGLFIFASEIKALLKHPLTPREVNIRTLDQIIAFPGPTSPGTMFKHIHSMKPGFCATVCERDVQHRQYWDLSYPLESDIENEKDELFYIQQLDDLLEQSVRRRLQADVPVGFYLSGGLDSSLIAQYTHKIDPVNPFHSFSIGFEDPKIDERQYQRIISDRVKSIHNSFLFGWEEISERLRKVIYHAEFPIKESYDACTMALAELVNGNNLKVILTGEGADEFFAGYVGYRLDMEGDRFDNSELDLEFALEKEIRENLWGDSNFLYEKNLYAFRELRQAFYADSLKSDFQEFDITTEPFIDVSKIIGRHPVHQRSYIDFKLRISDHLLSDHADRMSFANSVEGRFPFLDVDLLEFIIRMPPELLVKNSIEKYILKQLGKRLLPPEITNREKFAFVAPGSPWLLKQRIPWIEDLLSYETIKKQGYFDPGAVERLKGLYMSPGFELNQTFETDLLMVILTFGIFLDLFELPSL